MNVQIGTTFNQRVAGSIPAGLIRYLPPGVNLGADGMIPTMVTWAFAPEWLTPAEAARLLGPGYSEASILALIDIGAFDVKDSDQVLIEKQSLWEYHEAIAEVLTDEE